MRNGKVRVLLGSTFKMGAGTNVQDRLIATHDVDCPWRPADLEQRAGRIVRQGNKNDAVQIYRYATSGTFDSYLWQTVEAKQKFIAQIMSSKSPVRSCEDVDETALSYAEIKALCAGNPLIAEKMNLDVEVAKLRMLKAEYKSQRYRLEDDLLKRFPDEIAATKGRIVGIEKDLLTYKEHSEKLNSIQQTMTGGAVTASAPFAGMLINGTEYNLKEHAAKALLEACRGVKDKNGLPIGEYMGFQMALRFESFTSQIQLLLRGNITYKTDLGTDAFGNITRINNTLAELPKMLDVAKAQLEKLYNQQEAAKKELQNPFTLSDELANKEARLAMLNAELNIDGEGYFDIINEEDGRDTEPEEVENTILPDVDPVFPSAYEYNSIPERVSAKSERPSFLSGIEAYKAEKESQATQKKSNDRDI